MKLEIGRIVKGEALSGAITIALEVAEKTLPRGQLVRKEVLDAADRAERLISAAEARATHIVNDAQRAAAELRLLAETEGRADAAAKVAARAIALRDYEARSEERELNRSVELARLLAERLLGESLRVAPEQVIALARQALTEARGARRITVVAHPEDAAILRQSLPAMGLDPSTAQIRADSARARGNLRIETEIGVLDAELSPQLERLSLKLRESLAHDR